MRAHGLYRLQSPIDLSEHGPQKYTALKLSDANTTNTVQSELLMQAIVWYRLIKKLGLSSKEECIISHLGVVDQQQRVVHHCGLLALASFCPCVVVNGRASLYSTPGPLSLALSRLRSNFITE